MVLYKTNKTHLKVFIFYFISIKLCLKAITSISFLSWKVKPHSINQRDYKVFGHTLYKNVDTKNEMESTSKSKIEEEVNKTQ